MTPDQKFKKYLELCKLDASRRQFTIGPFFRNGVTLLKQQVRALNLVYALTESDPPLLSQHQSVAVIGGGIAGVTAAAAAVSLGSEVHLFEQRPVLCHLQHGCDTRYVHPNIYNWPRLGSDNPYAELPLLSWRAGTAAEVTEQIVTGFNELTNGAPHRFHLHLGATTRSADGCRVQWDNSSGNPRGGEKDFDLVILATGFGVEYGVGESSAQSYWRNDDLNQPTPGITSEKRQLCFITGTGDGGLIDLLRCRIKGFNQGWILSELIQMDASILVESLRRIAIDWNDLGVKFRIGRERWLFERFNSLNQIKLLSGLKERVEERLRGDTTAILNGRASTFAEALSLDSASLFNTLVAFLLYDLEAFSYVNGCCQPTEVDDEVTIEQNPLNEMDKPRRVTYKVDRLIIRHGTDLKKGLQMLSIKDKDIEDLKSRQRTDDDFDSLERLWPAGWWSEVRGRRMNLIGEGRNRIEFVPHATVALATTFVSTLSAILFQQLSLKQSKTDRSLYADVGEKDTRQSVGEFRATVHRLLRIQEEDLFQQIAFYEGNGERLKGKLARVFNLKSGLVGLSCRLGTAVVLDRGSSDYATWAALWRDLHVGTEIVTPPDFIKSMLACPMFYSTLTDSTQPARKVLMILFMDSEKNGFFMDKEIRQIVYSACAGFVRNLNKLGTHESQQKEIIRFASSEIRGYSVPATRSVEDTALISKYIGLVNPIQEADEKEFHQLLSPDALFANSKSLDVYI
jgi:hypothetical protein